MEQQEIYKKDIDVETNQIDHTEEEFDFDEEAFNKADSYWLFPNTTYE